MVCKDIVLSKVRWLQTERICYQRRPGTESEAIELDVARDW